jgi:hypothetical protein
MNQSPISTATLERTPGRASPWRAQTSAGFQAGAVLCFDDMTDVESTISMRQMLPERVEFSERAKWRIVPVCAQRKFPLSRRTRAWFQPDASVCRLLAACVLILAGCGKADKAIVATPAPAPGNVESAATNQVPAGEPDLAELNRDLLRWVVKNKRAPASFEDFAATSGVTIPPAPPGKKYVLAKDMHIKLVQQ